MKETNLAAPNTAQSAHGVMCETQDLTLAEKVEANTEASVLSGEGHQDGYRSNASIGSKAGLGTDDDVPVRRCDGTRACDENCGELWLTEPTVHDNQASPSRVDRRRVGVVNWGYSGYGPRHLESVEQP